MNYNIFSNSSSSEAARTIEFKNMIPRKIVEELDRYIIGQAQAKRVVAIALRNRMRRQKLPKEIREEIAPKNILMIGPTGVGKTELARRLAKLCGAPFIKVEATKYTEVGYVGRDVESMVRDLMATGISIVKQEMQQNLQQEARARAEERLLDIMLPGIKKSTENNDAQKDSREKFREQLHSGALDAREVEVSVRATVPVLDIFQGKEFGDFGKELGNIFNDKMRKEKVVKVPEAKQILYEEELEKLVDSDKVAEEARVRVQESGIIFIDEIDKIANRNNNGGIDVSREGVQRDILPIVEGSAVSTKWGSIDTTQILFIAAGAFTVSKPQDLIPELQGRFPIRVELDALSCQDFERILTEPENAMVKQYAQLLSAEKITLNITPDAVKQIAEIAVAANSNTENIGARRLQTVMEKLLEDLSFDAPDFEGQEVVIDSNYVEKRFKDFIEKQDLTRYIL